METKIRMSLSAESIDSAIRKLEKYQSDLEKKAKEICERLSSFGAVKASLMFSQSVYTGPKDYSISVEEIENGYVIKASGESVLFLEFGAGVKYGYGHPQAQRFGMGPGTWPDKHYSRNSKGERVANWENDKGWYLPKEKGSLHTYGNPPNMPMYQTARDMRGEIERIAREVFAK